VKTGNRQFVGGKDLATSSSYEYVHSL